MLKQPPRENEAVSWIFVLFWVLIIYTTIPFARSIQRYVVESFDRQLFTAFVLTSVAVATVLMVVYVIRLYRTTPSKAWKQIAWLFGISVIWVFFTLMLKTNPEETLHLVQYGVLGLLLFRALSHRVKDTSIYLSALLLGAIIGTMDEVIQWITPERFWDFRDVWINTISGGLMQLMIAFGLRPSVISGKIQRVSLMLLCRICIVLLLIFGFCLSNTPDFILWYTDRIPALSFLKTNESAMVEYGYFHEDNEIDGFYSRLSLEELREADQTRGADVARIIDKYDNYGDFLKVYTPLVDPFIHEVRVHLFRRDFHLAENKKYKNDEKKHLIHCTIAHQENLIMNKYFPVTLKNSNFVLPTEEVNNISSCFNEDLLESSAVSGHLITLFSKTQLLVFICVLLVALISIKLHSGRSKYFSKE